MRGDVTIWRMLGRLMQCQCVFLDCVSGRCLRFDLPSVEIGHPLILMPCLAKHTELKFQKLWQISRCWQMAAAIA